MKNLIGLFIITLCRWFLFVLNHTKILLKDHTITDNMEIMERYLKQLINLLKRPWISLNSILKKEI